LQLTCFFAWCHGLRNQKTKSLFCSGWDWPCNNQISVATNNFSILSYMSGPSPSGFEMRFTLKLEEIRLVKKCSSRDLL
jgi:hypothetical protein